MREEDSYCIAVVVCCFLPCYSIQKKADRPFLFVRRLTWSIFCWYLCPCSHHRVVSQKPLCYGHRWVRCFIGIPSAWTGCPHYTKINRHWVLWCAKLWLNNQESTRQQNSKAWLLLRHQGSRQARTGCKMCTWRQQTQLQLAPALQAAIKPTTWIWSWSQTDTSN